MTSDTLAAINQKSVGWRAALLSLICPGLGQLYAGARRRALLFLLPWLLLQGASFAVGVFAAALVLLLTLALVVLAVFDTAVMPRAAVRARPALIILAALAAIALQAASWGLHGFGRIAAALDLGTLEIADFAVRPYSAASASMAPTIDASDVFWAQIGYFDRHQPQRGDLATFLFPRDRSVTYVKRIVGLPGDRVQLRDGVVSVNGAPLGREAVGTPEGPESETVFVETTPEGRSYQIKQHRTAGPANTTKELLVPAGQYFLLGDNRDNSFDSRMFGAIRRDDLTGRPRLVYWSRQLSRIGTILR